MHEALINKYVEGFNTQSPERRRALLAEVFTEDCEYTDPHATVRGRSGVDAFIAGVREQFPTAVFSLAGPIDAHHDQARFTWQVSVDGAPKPIGVGFDVITIERNQIRRVYGFIDQGKEHAMKATVERYLATWNETDAKKRRAALEALYTKDCAYVDPMVQLRGAAQIDGFVGAMQKQFPGVVFVLGDRFDAHHDQARFTWNAVAQGLPEPVAIGFDVALFEGLRIKEIRGFLDKAPR
jgi:hypothetical protein